MALSESTVQIQAGEAATAQESAYAELERARAVVAEAEARWLATKDAREKLDAAASAVGRVGRVPRTTPVVPAP